MTGGALIGAIVAAAVWFGNDNAEETGVRTPNECRKLERWQRFVLHTKQIAIWTSGPRADDPELPRLPKMSFVEMPPELKSHLVLIPVAELNRHMGLLDDADAVAKRALAPPLHDFADTTHEAHTVLGLVELERGNEEAAKRHLLASATPSFLATFHPKMTLALALIRRGEPRVVLEYLERCAQFSVSGHPKERLNEWIGELRAGRVPDFLFDACW